MKLNAHPSCDKHNTTVAGSIPASMFCRVTQLVEYGSVTSIKKLTIFSKSDQKAGDNMFRFKHYKTVESTPNKVDTELTDIFAFQR